MTIYIKDLYSGHKTGAVLARSGYQALINVDLCVEGLYKTIYTNVSFALTNLHYSLLTGF